MKKSKIKNILILLLFTLYTSIDISVWFLTKIPYSKKLLGIFLKLNFYKKKIETKNIFVDKLVGLLIKFDLIIFRKKFKASSCLSRSITSKIILNFLGIDSSIIIGMNKLKDGQKIPHAWLINKKTGKEYTLGIDPKGTKIKAL